MSSKLQQLVKGRHEVHFTYQDYLKVYAVYANGKVKDYVSPYEMLICAKACYVNAKYQQCLKAINSIRLDYSTKILYERQTLLIKALYLNQGKQRQIQIKDAVKQFKQYINKCPGPPITNNHMNIIYELQELSLKKPGNEAENLSKANILKQIKALQELPFFEGLPSFLVSEQWNKQVNKYLKEDGPFPQPITNFQLLNHIFQFQNHDIPRKQYLKTLMFPLIQSQHFYALTKPHWQFLYKLFGGNPLKRMFSKGLNSHYVEGEDNSIKTLIRYNDQLHIAQWQGGLYWQKSVFPVLRQSLGDGQVKQFTKQKQYLLVKPGPIEQIDHQLKYVRISPQIIRNQSVEESRRKRHILDEFDIQEYQMEKSQTQGKIGLKNLKNTCYMNAVIQCLSHIELFARYFIQNQYLKKLNLSQDNSDGSHGFITCSFADILKRLWFCSKETQYIDPSSLKLYFSDRFKSFEGYNQQDAQQYLSFLLNCIHDDLNQRSVINLQKTKHKSKNKSYEQIKQEAMEHYKNLNKSIVTDTFVGFHSVVVTCKTCKHPNYRFSQFFSYHVDIPPVAPSITIYFVPTNTKKTKIPFEIEVCIDEMKIFDDVLETIKHEFEIILANQLYAYMINENYEVKYQVKPDEKVKELYLDFKSTKKKLYLFVYELKSNLEQNQELTMVTFHHQRYSELTVPDGYPRLIVIDYKLKKSDNQEQLLKYTAIQTIPEGGFFSSARWPYAEKLSIKHSEGTNYKSIIDLVTIRHHLKEFNCKKHKKTLGRNLGRMEISLQTCLINMSENEKIHKEEGWNCDKCKHVRQANKSDRMVSTGEILIFNFKRFAVQGNKITTKIQYPIRNFDVSAFLEDQHPKALYDLIGVILHRGSLNFGHYYSYCYQQNEDKWYCFNDQYLRQIDQQMLVDENAYILVYKKKH